GLGHRVVLGADGAARARVGDEHAVVGAGVLRVLVVARDDRVPGRQDAVADHDVARGQRPRVRDDQDDRSHALPLFGRQGQDAAMPRVQFSTHCAVLTLVPSPAPPGTARDTSVLPDEDHPTPISSHAKFASPVPKVAENVTWRPEITGPPETFLRALFVPTRSDCATFGAVVPSPTAR